MIYDCFLYYDEDMLLEIRLNTLADVVDRFVIVESTHTFTGKKRPLHFDINKYSQFKDKIIYVVHDKEPITKAAEESHPAREVIRVCQREWWWMRGQMKPRREMPSCRV